MSTSPGEIGRRVPRWIGLVAVAIAALLLVVDALPSRFGEGHHAALSALPLGCIALAYILHQPVRRPGAYQAAKALLLSAAFLLWAAYQLMPTLPVIVNDAAIALFVLDIALVIGEHSRSPAPRSS